MPQSFLNPYNPQTPIGASLQNIATALFAGKGDTGDKEAVNAAHIAALRAQADHSAAQTRQILSQEDNANATPGRIAEGIYGSKALVDQQRNVKAGNTQEGPQLPVPPGAEARIADEVRAFNIARGLGDKNSLNVSKGAREMQGTGVLQNVIEGAGNRPGLAPDLGEMVAALSGKGNTAALPTGTGTFNKFGSGTPGGDLNSKGVATANPDKITGHAVDQTGPINYHADGSISRPALRQNFAGAGAPPVAPAAPGAPPLPALPGGQAGLQPPAGGGDMSGSPDLASLVARLTDPGARAAAQAQLQTQQAGPAAPAAPASPFLQVADKPMTGPGVPTAAVTGAPPAPSPFVPKTTGNSRTTMVQLSPEEITSYGSQHAAGMPMNQVLPGYGTTMSDARRAAHAEAIRQIMAGAPGMTHEQAGEELANRSIDFVAGKRSVGQLQTMLGSSRQAVDQLDFNVKKTSEAMAKLPSSDLSPVVNAIARGAEKWTGDPAYSELFFFMHAAAMESAKILSGGTASVAQLNQGAADEAKKWANVNMTPQSWNQGVAPAMLAEGAERLKTYERAISRQRIGGNRGDETPQRRSGDQPVEFNGYKFPNQQALDAYKKAAAL